MAKGEKGKMSCLRTTNPSADDKSTVIKGGRVDDRATREKTAPAAPTIGPRENGM